MNLPRYLSLGAGVQSSTVALMAEHGEIEPIDAAIFADVRAEPASVYAWLDWLETQLSYPVYRVSHGDLRENVLARVNRQKSGSGGPPFFTAGEAKEGMLPRQCTRDFKLDPIEKQIRALVGLKPRQRAPKEIVAETVLGISWDEAHRMKLSRLPFVRNVYPLVERSLTRGHCLEWMEAHGYPKPPRSACTFCPYRSDHEWQHLKAHEPEAFADAVAMDERIRNGYVNSSSKLYVHRSCKPLAEVDFRGAAEFGQIDAFGNECEGMCGV